MLIITSYYLMAMCRVSERLPSVITAMSAVAGVMFAFDSNALAAWSAAIVCSGGVIANWIFAKYREMREIRRQQDSEDREALVESIRDRVTAEFELAARVTENTKHLEQIKADIETWMEATNKRIRKFQGAVTEYEELIRSKIKACQECGKVILNPEEES